MSETILAWHFVRQDGTTGEGRLPVRVGETLREDRALELCVRGLHWSRRAIDALGYAPGPVVCRVLASGEYVEQGDKGCSASRTCVAMADATDLLHDFGCWCAERALMREREAGREPDARSWQAIEVKRAWLRGEATDAELTVAREAAWRVWASSASCALSASWTAVMEANTAWAASAAWAAWAASASRAVRDTWAAWAASDTKSGETARAAFREEQNRELETSLLALLGLEATDVCRPH